MRHDREGRVEWGQIYDSPTSMPIPAALLGPEAGGIMRSMSFTVELPDSVAASATSRTS